MRLWIPLGLVAAAVGLLVSVLTRSTSPDPETIILVIRHAEKSSEPGNDPPLSEAGKARARELIHVAVTSGVQKLYASEFLRTQQTLIPLLGENRMIHRRAFQALVLCTIAVTGVSDRKSVV